jgi:hypothetical protein
VIFFNVIFQTDPLPAIDYRTKRKHSSERKPAGTFHAAKHRAKSTGRRVDADRLEVATDEAIAACGGNVRQAVAALIVANEFLESQVRELQAAVSNGYARGKFEPVPRDRKDWYD